jgi:cytochrome c553
MPKLGKNLHDNPFIRTRSAGELVDFLEVGRRSYDPLNLTGIDMPPRGGNSALSDQDLAAIAAYLESLQAGG